MKQSYEEPLIHNGTVSPACNLAAGRLSVIDTSLKAVQENEELPRK